MADVAAGMGGARLPVFPLPPRRGRAQNVGRRLGERGDGGGLPGVAGDRRRADVARPWGLRELHWHANAAEWAYVIKGQCRVTTINPQGQSQIVDFDTGDV